jgi:hypothetical protein
MDSPAGLLTMTDGPKASIRKNRQGRWRGYIGGVRVAEFEDIATESAEAAANRWLAAPTKPQGRIPATPEPVRMEPPTAATITINVDGISDQEKATEKFQSAYRDMMGQLMAPGFIPVLCAHEAAHAIFFMIAGMKEFEPLPATLEYVPQIDDYEGHLAAIRPLDIPSWVEGQFWDWLFAIAQGHAAGGVVARKLMPCSDGGDQDDKRRFLELCENICKLDSNVKIDAEDVWKQAQDAVKLALENPDNVAEIQKQAAILRPKLGL